MSKNLDYGLEGKNVVVTGGANGIGKATSHAFANQGARVAVVDIESDTGAETVREIESGGGKASFFRTNVTRTDEVNETAKKILNQFGRIDVLANVAGGWSMYGVMPKMLWETTDEEWSLVHDLNLKSQFIFCRAVIPQFIKQKFGKIINVTSTSVLSLPVDQAAYAISKTGVIALTKLLAKSLAPHGILVNAVGPGITDTRVYRNRRDGTNLQDYLKMVPLGRAGKPEEVANMIVYLASGLSDFTTGQVVYVNGGTM